MTKEEMDIPPRELISLDTRHFVESKMVYSAVTRGDLERLVEFVVSRVSRAYEEAARAACYMCENSVAGDGTPSATYFPEDRCWSHVYEDSEGYGAAETCHATGVRSLKDSLAAETSSVTAS